MYTHLLPHTACTGGKRGSAAFFPPLFGIGLQQKLCGERRRKVSFAGFCFVQRLGPLPGGVLVERGACFFCSGAPSISSKSSVLSVRCDIGVFSVLCVGVVCPDVL